MSSKPRLLRWFDSWGWRAAAIILTLAIPLNAFLNPLEEWLPVLVMGLVMGGAAYGMARGILAFQRWNASTMRREMYDRFVLLCAGLGALLCLGIVLLTAIGGRRGLILALQFPMGVGAGLGASHAWALRERFRPRNAP